MAAFLWLSVWPPHWAVLRWQALRTGQPVVAMECLDRWRPSFNDPEAVYVYDAAVLGYFHEVDVQVRGKNKMGAWIKGSVSCALKDDGSLNNDGTAQLIFTKMSRPEDGEVPP